MPEPTEWGRWVRQLRIAQDLTQEALAEAVGCAVQTVRAFERGLRRPSREMSERMAQILRVPAGDRARFVGLARQSAGRPAAEGSARPDSGAAIGHIRPAALPNPVMPLIGRSVEWGDLKRMLTAEGVRLVTLMGPGGAGKTHLALHVARALATAFRDGARFVALADTRGPNALAYAIADGLGLKLGSGAPSAEQIAGALSEFELLLVLDDFEPLLADAEAEETLSAVRAILEQAPGVRLLITSRERLRLQAEQIYELGGLDQPVDGADDDDGVLLFAQRARQVDAAFALTGANRQAVRRICQLVGGLPLGIEMAAAWTRVLKPEEIAQEIERSVDFLSRSERDTPRRHQNLSALFEHSWRLLRENEQEALAALSVFTGGFTREAARAITGATLPLLAGLLDKSLIRRVGDTAARYEMHELIRDYASRQLNNAEARDRHARHFLDWVRELRHGFEGDRWTAKTLTVIRPDMGNVRQAMVHALQQGWDEAVIQAAADLTDLYLDSSDYAQARRSFEAWVGLARSAQEPCRPASADVLGTLISSLALFSTLTGLRLDAGISLFAEAVGLLERHPGALARSNALSHYASLLLLSGSLDEAAKIAERNVALQTREGNAYGLCLGEFDLANIILHCGDFTRAERLLLENEERWARLHHAGGLMMACAAHFELAVAQRDWAAAEGIGARMARLHTEANLEFTRAYPKIAHGVLRLHAGDAAAALADFEQVEDIFRDQHNEWGVARASHRIVEALIQLGDVDGALTPLRLGTEIARRRGLMMYLNESARLWATLLIGRGQTGLGYALLRAILADSRSASYTRLTAEGELGRLVDADGSPATPAGEARPVLLLVDEAIRLLAP